MNRASDRRHFRVIVECFGNLARHAGEVLDAALAAAGIARDRVCVANRVVRTSWADALIATYHPAAILRVDPADRPRYEAELLEDLRTAVRMGVESSLATRVAP